MDKKTIVNHGWMTDVAVACDDTVTVDSNLFKACVTSADVHELVYGEEVPGEDEVQTPEEQVNNNSSNVTGEPIVEEEIPDPQDEEVPVVDPEDEEIPNETTLNE